MSSYLSLIIVFKSKSLVNHLDTFIAPMHPVQFFDHSIERHHFVTRMTFSNPILVLELGQAEVSDQKRGYVFKIVP